MKKTIYILVLLLTATLNAQLSFEGKLGVNSYLDSGSYSENLIHGGIAVSYAWNRVSLRPSFNMGQLQNEHSECYYSEDYINTNLDLLYRISDGWIKLFPYIGIGYTNIGNEHDLLNLTAGGVAKIYFTDTFYFLADVSGSSLYGLSRPLGFDRDTAPRGTQAVNIVYSAGIGFDILKPKKKKQPQKIIERHFTKEVCCDQKIEVYPKQMVIPNEVVLFDEGSSKIRKDQLAAIIKMTDYLEANPNMKIELVGAACGGQGSPERNFQLSEDRAKAVYDKMSSLRGGDSSRLSYRGVGVDKKYTNKNDIDANKRVNFLIYK